MTLKAFLLFFKVCDFGCAECRALAVFRSIDTVQRLIGVDIERDLLVNNWYRLEPLISDFLFRRRRPLHIDVFHGSLLEYDHRLNGVDAVTLIEVLVCSVLCTHTALRFVV